MTLYLSPDLTPDEIRKASKAGVVGASHLVCFRPPNDLFGSKVSNLILVVSPQIRKEASSRMRCIIPSLKQCRRLTWSSTFMVNCHRTPHPSVSLTGHKTLDSPFEIQNTHILNAESRFLPHLHKLHATFPSLRIVLEHATTRASVEAVKACGPTVACTITAHHLALTVDDWAGQSWNYCKPVAKFPDDREALRSVIAEGG